MVETNKSFLEFYLVNNSVWNFQDYYYSSFWDSVSTCIKIEIWFYITLFDVLSTFYSVFVYISSTIKMPLT